MKKQQITASGGKEKDKKKVKRAIIAAFAALAVVALLALGADLVLSGLKNRSVELAESRRAAEESGIFFFEPDYSEDIMQDELYLALDRKITFKVYGETVFLTESAAARRGGAAELFYNYFQCIIGGDYKHYPDFFTESYLNDPKTHIPEKFTMQKIYDIGVTFFDRRTAENGVTEIYEVRYSIFENNGTFRRDIPSMETRTLVFELYINGEGEAKINSIAHRAAA